MKSHWWWILFPSVYQQSLYLPWRSIQGYFNRIFILIELFVFLLLICESSFHVLNMRPLSDICLVNIFSQSVACLFIFLNMSLNSQEYLFILMKTNLSTFPFMCSAFCVYSKEPFQFEWWKDISVFSSGNYSFSFYDSSRIHVCRVLRKELQLNILHVYPDGQTQLWKGPLLLGPTPGVLISNAAAL